MTNSKFLRLIKNIKKLEDPSIPLFIKNDINWNIFKQSIFDKTHTVLLSKNFNVYGNQWMDRIYTYENDTNNLITKTNYIFHENDDPPKLSQVNDNNLYDYIRISKRETYPTMSYLTPYYNSNMVYLIDGYNNHIFIPLHDETCHDHAIYFKFFTDTNPDLYWGKDLTQHGDIKEQLKYIFGSNFDKFIYHPLELLGSPSNSKILDLPDYNMVYDKNVVKTVKEDPEFEYVQLPEEVKQTELNFDEFYSNNVGFKCEPTYSTLELRKFFLYGFVTGSLSTGLILSILALICN